MFNYNYIINEIILASYWKIFQLLIFKNNNLIVMIKGVPANIVTKHMTMYVIILMFVKISERLQQC